MTDYDEDYDDDESEEIDSNLEPEDVFKMVTMNLKTKKLVRVQLEDSEGDVIELRHVIQELLNYIAQKLSDTDGNQFTDQIMPLMAQATVSGLGRMLGLDLTGYYMSDPTTRIAFVQMMCVAFLLLKFVQQKDLHITTYEEDVTDEEIDQIQRKSKAHSTMTLAALAGVDPIAVLHELRDAGKITNQDLEELLHGDKSNDNSGENK